MFCGLGKHQVDSAKQYYTNHQLYTMLRPDQMDSPYIYDNFEWSHCDVSEPVVGCIFVHLKVCT